MLEELENRSRAVGKLSLEITHDESLMCIAEFNSNLECPFKHVHHFQNKATDKINKKVCLLFNTR